jgi:hypothetical protein
MFAPVTSAKFKVEDKEVNIVLGFHQEGEELKKDEENQFSYICYTQEEGKEPLILEPDGTNFNSFIHELAKFYARGFAEGSQFAYKVHKQKEIEVPLNDNMSNPIESTSEDIIV